MKKKKLTPRAARKNESVKAYEAKQIQEAFLTDEPVRSIAHRFGIDTGSVYYHCRDLLEARGSRPKGRPAARRHAA